MKIQTKQTCNDMQCKACYYNDERLNHSGEITEKLISCDYIQYGDYDNSCAVERANVRYLENENLIAHKETGSYYFVKAWIIDNDENRELLNSLENYPCFDEELVTQIEMEIENDYIKDNDDIFRNTKNETLKDVLDFLDMRCLEPEIYHQVKENLNMEFIVESGGNGYIDLEKMVNEYNRLLIEKNPIIQKLVELKETIADKPIFPISFYESANDMLTHRKMTNNVYSQDEIKEIIEYTAQLEILNDKLERSII